MASLHLTAPRKPTGILRRHIDTTTSSSNTQANIASRRTSRLAKRSPYNIRFVEVHGDTARFLPRSTLGEVEGQGSGGDVVEIDMDDDEADEEAVIQAILGELGLYQKGHDITKDSEDKTATVLKWLQTHSPSDFKSQPPQTLTQYGPPRGAGDSDLRPGEAWRPPAGFPYVGYPKSWIPFVCEVEPLVRDRLTFRKKARLVQLAPDGRRTLREWDDKNVGEWLVDAPISKDTMGEDVSFEPPDERTWKGDREPFVGTRDAGASLGHSAGAYFEEYFTVVQRDLGLGIVILDDGPIANLPFRSAPRPQSNPNSMDIDHTDDNVPLNGLPKYYLVIKKHLDHDQELLSSVHPHGPIRELTRERRIVSR
jgi:hypothetical protein